MAGCSLAEARRSIVKLAEFQASWWDSPRLDRLEWMPLKDDETGVYQEIYAGAWESLIKKAPEAMPRGLRLLGDRLIIEIPRIKGQTHGTSPNDYSWRLPPRQLLLPCECHGATIGRFRLGVLRARQGGSAMLPRSSLRHSPRSNEGKGRWVSCARTTPPL